MFIFLCNCITLHWQNVINNAKLLGGVQNSAKRTRNMPRVLMLWRYGPLIHPFSSSSTSTVKNEGESRQDTQPTRCTV